LNQAAENSYLRDHTLDFRSKIKENAQLSLNLACKIFVPIWIKKPKINL
jgi:hypothetical protein